MGEPSVSSEQNATGQELPDKIFNDPIHGTIKMHPLLVKIIDTPQFQRLRHIKQLSFGYWVYPGACHNRFEHSLGVCHLAGELAKTLRESQPELNITKEDILCVQIAGLCHDLGHGPFSHLYDDLLKEVCKNADKMDLKHETRSVKMFEHLVEDTENKLKPVMEEHDLKEDDRKFISELIQGLDENSNGSRGPGKKFLYDIVANSRNGVDVDKWDYLARDCYYLGVQNNFDYRRFLRFARVCSVDGEMQICTRDKEAQNLYDMFATRKSLHCKAFQHRVVNVIKIMVIDALKKADDFVEIAGSGGKKFSITKAISDMEAYTKLTDHIFEQILYSSKEELKDSKEILMKIVKHQHYKFVGQIFLETEKKPLEMINELVELDTGKKLQKSDFSVIAVAIGYGKKKKNLINGFNFYSKDDPKKAKRIELDQVGAIPEKSEEYLIQVFWKGNEDLKKAKDCFEDWKKNYKSLPEENKRLKLQINDLKAENEMLRQENEMRQKKEMLRQKKEMLRQENEMLRQENEMRQKKEMLRQENE
ncbi:deoxynucleoside triphosphate triphosphohydrolase SAMHD1 [Denticeps clupeoides]|uniref:deoxynucleoside triphosphate triphosphohydrolase SAMHD1 n=1 Tax=Denticeps clupeoides TaxID=299321 RepID=UPI0010A48D97|nr:deoxynucleoside triphosphate triphosphohydrolase SAMHD1-like [Denticeps clupeoides]